MSRARLPLALRLYRRALCLLPREFRAEHGDGMLAMLHDEWRERSAVRRCTLLARAGLDLVGTAVGTRVGALGADGGPDPFRELSSDLRVSARTLARTPLFTAAAVASLALGVGGVATVYAVADRLLLRPITSVPEPERLVDLVPSGFSYPLYRDFAAQLTSLEGLAAHRVRRVALAPGAGVDPHPADAQLVSGNFFEVLGVSAARGRMLRPADDLPGAPAVAVLSHAVWTELGEPADVLGSTVRVNGAAFEVVGVAPVEFTGLGVWDRPAVWIPVASWPSASLGQTPDVHERGWWWIAAVGRLRSGVSLARASEDVAAAGLRIGAVHPEEADELEGFRMVPMRTRAAQAAGAALRPMVVALAAVVALALLAAASNVANLLLSRATRRTRELGIRAALGADRARLGRLLAVESGLLVTLGTVLGLLLSVGALRALASVDLPGGLTLGAARLRPDLRLVALIGGVLALVAAIAGVGPALMAARAAPAGLGSTRGTGATRASTRLRAVFVALQVMVGVVLLAGTALFGRSMLEALRVELGFAPGTLAVMEVEGPLFEDDRAGAAAALDRLVATLRGQPGVEAASWTSLVPLTEGMDRETFDIVGRPWPGRRPSIEVNGVGSDYFRTMGLRIVRGDAEAVNRADVPRGVVNEAAVRRFWPDRDPIGDRVAVMGSEIEIAAVVADARLHGFDHDAEPTLFGILPGEPGAALGSVTVGIVARGPGAAAVAVAATELARSVDSRLVVTYAATGSGLMSFALAPQRMGALVLGMFGLLALALALTGIYGVVAYAVGTRLREFGVRLTLGARPERVTREVVLRNLTPVLCGVGAGALASTALTRVAAAQLFGIAPDDPTATLGATAVVLATALAASWLPARRAGRVPPATVLAAD